MKSLVAGVLCCEGLREAVHTQAGAMNLESLERSKYERYWTCVTDVNVVHGRTNILGRSNE